MATDTPRYTLKQLRQAWGAGRRSAGDLNYLETAAAVADFLTLRGFDRESGHLSGAIDSLTKAVLDDDPDWFVHAVMFAALLERARPHFRPDAALDQMLLEQLNRALVLIEADASQ